MKRRTKKTSAIILLFIILAAFGSWFCGRVPEPEYDGKKLGTYLEFKNVWDWEGSRKAVEALGPRAVPYLTSVAAKRPTVFELKYKAWYLRNRPKKSTLLPNPFKSEGRRNGAIMLLQDTGTNCIPALPVLIDIVKTERTNGLAHNSLLVLGKFAAGTEFEMDAFNALKAAAQETGQDRDFTRAAYYGLGSFTNQAELAVPILLQGLKDPRIFDHCAAALQKLGPRALPQLRQAASHETGFIRPAGVVLEKIEGK
jgi:hypothetical protein